MTFLSARTTLIAIRPATINMDHAVHMTTMTTNADLLVCGITTRWRAQKLAENFAGKLFGATMLSLRLKHVSSSEREQKTDELHSILMMT